MRRRRPPERAVRTFFTALWGVVLLALAVTFGCSVKLETPRLTFWVASQRLTVSWFSATLQRDRKFEVTATPAAHGVQARAAWIPAFSSGYPALRGVFAFHSLHIPLGSSAVLLAVPAGLLWRRYVRAPRAGECSRCRYSRAGLDDRAACPECGAPGPGAVIRFGPPQH